MSGAAPGVRLRRERIGTLVDVGPAIAAGGEATVYTLAGEPRFAAKVYHHPSYERAAKLTLMIDRPPRELSENPLIPSVVWPVDRLLQGDRPVGFLMARLAAMRPIADVYNPRSRAAIGPRFTHAYLYRTARNLCQAVAAVHEAGYVIGDVNEGNVLVADSALVTLVDTDSFQVRDPARRVVYRCRVGKPEFIPPELATRALGEVDRTPEQDRFGLAVLLFRLLMEGRHPFDGVYSGAGEVPELSARIAAGHFPYARSRPVPYHPGPLFLPFGTLPPALQELFVRCFDDGHRNPYSRPDARAWCDAITGAEAALRQCDRHADHRFGAHLPACPWCERERERVVARQAAARALNAPRRAAAGPTRPATPAVGTGTSSGVRGSAVRAPSVVVGKPAAPAPSVAHPTTAPSPPAASPASPTAAAPAAMSGAPFLAALSAAVGSWVSAPTLPPPVHWFASVLAFLGVLAAYSVGAGVLGLIIRSAAGKSQGCFSLFCVLAVLGFFGACNDATTGTDVATWARGGAAVGVAVVALIAAAIAEGTPPGPRRRWIAAAAAGGIPWVPVLVSAATR